MEKGKPIVLSLPLYTLGWNNATWRQCCCYGENLSSQFDDVQCCSVMIKLRYSLSTLQSCCCHHRMLHQIGALLEGCTQCKARQAVRWQQCIDSKECAAINQMVSKFVMHWRLLLLFIDHCTQQAQHMTSGVAAFTAFQHGCSLPWARAFAYQIAGACGGTS